MPDSPGAVLRSMADDLMTYWRVTGRPLDETAMRLLGTVYIVSGLFDALPNAGAMEGALLHVARGWGDCAIGAMLTHMSVTTDDQADLQTDLAERFRVQSEHWAAVAELLTVDPAWMTQDNPAEWVRRRAEDSDTEARLGPRKKSDAWDHADAIDEKKRPDVADVAGVFDAARYDGIMDAVLEEADTSDPDVAAYLRLRRAPGWRPAAARRQLGWTKAHFDAVEKRFHRMVWEARPDAGHTPRIVMEQFPSGFRTWAFRLGWRVI